MLLAITALLIALIAWASWVAVRGLMARDELQSAAAQLRVAQSDASLDALGDLEPTVDAIAARAARAAALTSDPLWRAAEVVPWAGPNLVAFRETATSIDDIVSNALPPMLEVADTVSPDSLTLRDGGLPTAELEAAQPSIAEARAIVADAAELVESIDTAELLPQIGEAIAQVSALADDAESLLAGLDTAAQIIPSMLGENDARDYLLLFQNNAELRAGGGIPGATAIVQAESGQVALGPQASSADFVAPDGEPITELSPQEQAIFGDQLGTFIQNVTLTPDFTRTGPIAQAWWSRVGGVDVDGVVSLDPVALSYILGATGPVTLIDGSQLTAENAVARLLNETYLQVEDPALQDAFFAEAAAAVFQQVTQFEGDAGALLDALVRAVDERRILIWSADEGEQQLLETTPLAGDLPYSNEGQSAFGVYLNDDTGAKMSYYLDAHFGATSEVCRNDRRPEFVIGAKLTSNAPANAASLPDYITGAEIYGVPRGNVRTLVQFVLPPNAVVTEAFVGRDPVDVSTNLLDDHLIATFETELAPGESVDVSLRVLGDAGASEQIVLEHTPMARAATQYIDSSRTCSSRD